MFFFVSHGELLNEKCNSLIFGQYLFDFNFKHLCNLNRFTNCNRQFSTHSVSYFSFSFEILVFNNCYRFTFSSPFHIFQLKFRFVLFFLQRMGTYA